MGATFIADHAVSVESLILIVPQLFKGARIPPLAAEGSRKGAANPAARRREEGLGNPEARAHGRSQETGDPDLTAPLTCRVRHLK
jgi:hypothetical protein